MRRSVLAVLLAVLPLDAALAHTGHGSVSGFLAGFAHPLSGIDHVLAMVLVGLLAAHIGGRALWAVPLSFVAMMIVGGALGMSGVSVPFVELGIALSVFVLGAAVALQWRVPVAAAMAVAGFFAIFHGHAHGAEMPQTLSGFEYGAGFVAATALLHGAGIAAGVALGKSGALAARIAGGLSATVGLVLVSGAI